MDKADKTTGSPPYKGGVAARPSRADGVVLTTQERINVHSLPEFKTFRTTLRKNLTPAEAAFWRAVKNSKLDGRKFRRQVSVGKYVLDFYCPSEKLAVELDGSGHFSTAGAEYDRERKLFLRFFGIKVIRFENKMVWEDTEWMISLIRAEFGWREREGPS